MEVLKVLVVVLTALGTALAGPGLGLSSVSGDYQQAVDATLATVQSSSDFVVEVADDAVVKTEDVVNALTLAKAEARFSLIHVANFATVNNLTALQAMVPVNPSDACVAKDIPAIQMITKQTGLYMVECFSDKVKKAEDILRDTLALDDQAAVIMPKAVARIEKCSESEDVLCLEKELKVILDGSATIEHQLAQNVMRAEQLLSSLHSDLVQCLGQLTALFVAEVGKYGSKTVSCFMMGS